MRKRDLLLAIGVAVLGVFGIPAAQAGETLWYGSRVGMEVAVISKSGIGTAKAIIKIRMTKEKAAEHCTEYAGDSSAGCVKRLLKEDGARLKPTVNGNCTTGAFTDMYGYRYVFKGRNKNRKGEFAPEYIIVDRKTGQVLDDSMVSGYAVALGVFEALCPNFKSSSSSGNSRPAMAVEETAVPAAPPIQDIPGSTVEYRALEVTDENSYNTDWAQCLIEFESNQRYDEDGYSVVSQEIDAEREFGHQVLVSDKGDSVMTARCFDGKYVFVKYRLKDAANLIPRSSGQ